MKTAESVSSEALDPVRVQSAARSARGAASELVFAFACVETEQQKNAAFSS